MIWHCRSSAAECMDEHAAGPVPSLSRCMQAFRKGIGVRIREETEIIEGEVILPHALCECHSLYCGFAACGGCCSLIAARRSSIDRVSRGMHRHPASMFVQSANQQVRGLLSSTCNGATGRHACIADPAFLEPAPCFASAVHACRRDCSAGKCRWWRWRLTGQPQATLPKW